MTRLSGWMQWVGLVAGAGIAGGSAAAGITYFVWLWMTEFIRLNMRLQAGL